MKVIGEIEIKICGRSKGEAKAKQKADLRAFCNVGFPQFMNYESQFMK